MLTDPAVVLISHKIGEGVSREFRNSFNLYLGPDNGLVRMPFQVFMVSLFEPAAGAEPFTDAAVLIRQGKFGVYSIYDFVVGASLGSKLDGKLFERFYRGELRKCAGVSFVGSCHKINPLSHFYAVVPLVDLLVTLAV